MNSSKVLVGVLALGLGLSSFSSLVFAQLKVRLPTRPKRAKRPKRSQAWYAAESKRVGAKLDRSAAKLKKQKGKPAWLETGGRRYEDKGVKDAQGRKLLSYVGPAKPKGNVNRGMKPSRGTGRSLSQRLAAERSGGAGGRARQREAPRATPVPWAERLETSRTQLKAATAPALAGELASGDDAHTFATLERAYKLKTRLPESDLATALNSVREAKAAHAVAYHLSRHDTPTARGALASYVARGGAGADQVEKFLGADGSKLVAAAKLSREKREGWMNDAATGRPGSRSQARAIEALAGEPGKDVAALLRQLASDQNESVSKKATAALEKRKQSGL